MINPLVSVVITTYNLAWCVRETITSVLAQTYPHTEIIVVDDASADDTARIVASFGPRVKLIRNVRRIGQAAINRNTGIRAASGEYIAFLDGDDLWEPEKLAVQVAAARQYPTAGLIAVDGIQFHHDDGSILKSSLYADDIPWSSGAEIELLNLYERLLQGCCIDTPSQLMAPRRVLDSVQGFTPDLPHLPGLGRGEDHEFMIKVASRFDFAIIRSKLVKYRYVSSSLSARSQKHDAHYFVLCDIGILRCHLAAASDLQKPIIQNILQDKINFAFQKAVYEGSSGRRVWATRYMLQIVKRDVTQVKAKIMAKHLARIWLPNWVARVVGAVRSQPNKTEEQEDQARR